MSYNASEIARYIIYHEEKAGRPVSNLRLQKLLYFVQAQFLVNKKEPCFLDRMEAWDFGPVVPAVYYQYRYYGSGVIPFQGNPSFPIGPENRQLIDSVLDYCSRYSTSTLVDKTHRQAPWKNAYAASQAGVGDEISNHSIYRYFMGK